jgi:hypothetical protein
VPVSGRGRSCRERNGDAVGLTTLSRIVMPGGSDCANCAKGEIFVPKKMPAVASNIWHANKKYTRTFNVSPSPRPWTS